MLQAPLSQAIYYWEKVNCKSVLHLFNRFFTEQYDGEELIEETANIFCCASSDQPPIVPKVSNDGDTSNFEAYPEDDWNKTPPVPPKDLEIFKNF